MGQLRRTAQEDLSDETLSERTRDGDDLAFSDLYRRHIDIARRTARYVLHSSNDVDDVVAEAFTGVLAALRNGKGPRDNFRAYLLACVRNRCYVRRLPPIPIVDEQLESLTPVFEDPERYVEADTVARAFSSLRPRWQRTLWLTEVEQLPAAEVAAELHLAPNATAALARRARHAFASAYLSEHLAAPPASSACAEIGPKLGAYVRDDLGTTERAAVATHLTRCASCTHAVDQLEDLNASLRSLQGPSLGLAAAGAGASGLLATTTVGSGTFAAIGGAGLLAKVTAVALLVMPTAAIVTRQLSASTDADGTHPAVVVGLRAPRPSDASAGGPGGQSHDTPAVGGSDSTRPNPAVSPSVAVGVAAALAGAERGTAVDGAVPRGVPVVSASPISLPAFELSEATMPDPVIPGLGVPSTVRPGATLPVVALPRVTPPGTSLPGATLPGATLPGVTSPSATLPGATSPSATLPGVSLPGVTVPPSIPSVTLPSVAVPPITVPPLTLPPVALPPVTLPPIGAPPLG